MGGRLMRAHEVAARLEMSDAAFYRWVRDGECPLTVLRLGKRMRFSSTEVERFIDADLPKPVAS
jgi:excisionase family DNA binding protein